MADNRYKNFSEEAIRELQKLEKEQKRIESDKQKYEKQGHDKRLKQYKDFALRLKEIEELQSEITQDEKLQLKFKKESEKSIRSQLKLSEQVRKELQISSSTNNVFSSISEKIAKDKAIQAEFEGDIAEKSARREATMSSILDDMTSQAKSVERALQGESEREQFEQRRRDIASITADLTEDEKQELLDAVDRTEQLFEKEQRILAIKKGQKDLYSAIPSQIQGAIEFGKGLVSTLKNAGAAAMGVGVLLAIAASAVTLFVDLDQQAESFRKNTGIAVSQMKDLNSQANRLVGEFREIGLQAEDFFGIQEQLVGVLGDTVRVSDEIAGVQAIITKNFGATNENAAKSLQIFQSLGGVSTETAANLQLQTAELAKQAGVAPAKIFEDIANSSDTIYGLFRGNTEELVKQAVEARRLGTNLSDVVAVTEKLLDFESSITQELEASAFVGGQFNLTRARSLAAAGEEVEAQKEILRQIQRSGDFRQQDLFTQRALAAAAGMSVAEINRQLTVQERLNSLSADQREAAERAIEQGLDISQINEGQLNQEVQKFKLQKEQQGQVANLSNAFQGIAASLGSAIVPLLEAVLPIVTAIAVPFRFIGEVLKTINENLGLMLSFYGSILAMVIAVNRQKIIGLGTDIKNLFVNRKQLLTEGKSAVAAIYKSFAAIPYGLGIPLAIASIAGLYAAFSTMSSKASQVGDLMINPNGGPIVSSPTEGGLFQGTRNDALIMAPRENLMGSQNTGGTDKLVRSIERLEKAYMKGAQVNLDGQRVTSRLGRVVNESTRNNFSLA